MGMPGRLGALVVLVILTLAGSRGQSVDMTLMPDTSGATVVDAVVDKIHAQCIFNDDRLFLRRLAYVESLDGNDPKTYRPGYDGGIWQVDEQMLRRTQSCPNVIKRECDIIKDQFGIDWPTVSWSDLRMPLYSALGATLYLIQRLAHNTEIPGDLNGQADIWAHYYHLNEPMGTYVTLAAQATSYVCTGDLDLAFIIDSSGSILKPDYVRQLDFVADVVRALPVDEGDVRVASVMFGSQVEVTFNFSTYSNKSDIIQAILNTNKDDGGTNTPGALNITRTVVFQPENGARPTARKVAVLLTDGESYNTTLTIAEAKKLRDDGVLIFAIGVGRINMNELMAVASEPACSRVYLLANYANIDSILYEIQKSTCEAPKVLTPQQPIVGNIPNNGTTSTTIDTIRPSNNRTIVAVRANCSIVDIYVSYTYANPNAAIYTEKYSATHDRPAFLTMEDQLHGMPVYLTLVGTRLPVVSGFPICSRPTYEVKFETRPDVQIVCREHSTYRDCHPEDFIGSEYETLMCPDFQRPVANPCIAGSKITVHPHPYDVHYFIRCDLLGKMYITLCPSAEIFNPSTLACGYENHEVGDGVVLPDGYNNPCTPDTIKNGIYFFAFSVDRHQFIQCDVWGVAWLKQCPTNHIWNDPAHTCVPDTLHEFDSTTVASITITNPCTPQNLAAGILFFPHPCDHTKYIHCDIGGNYYIQSCPGGTYYDPATFVCVIGDPQPNNPGCHR